MIPQTCERWRLAFEKLRDYIRELHKIMATGTVLSKATHEQWMKVKEEDMRTILQLATPTTSDHEEAAQWLHDNVGFKCDCGYCQFPKPDRIEVWETDSVPAIIRMQWPCFQDERRAKWAWLVFRKGVVVAAGTEVCSSIAWECANQDQIAYDLKKGES